MWPDNQSGKEHIHLPRSVLRKMLKKKYLTRQFGWDKPANPRTNPPKSNVKYLNPRRRAYGPF